MIIELLQRYATPDANHGVGSILDIDAKRGKELIDGGYAIEVKDDRKVTAVDPEMVRVNSPDTATVHVENAMLPTESVETATKRTAALSKKANLAQNGPEKV